MRFRPFSKVALAALSFVAFPLAARADLAPEPGYVETCTLANHAKADLECVECNTYHGEYDKCVKQFEPQGYTQACRTAGASVWSEIWCKAKAGGAPATTTPEPAPAGGDKPVPATTNSPSKCAGGDAAGFLPMMLGIAMVAARARRRSAY
jgi:hypothetical protein